jgi:cysteine-rich repeat protein
MAAALVVTGLSACQPDSKCGNGVIDKGEECDDANFNENDGCVFSCRLDERAGGLCYPTINVPAPKNAGRVNCAPTMLQPCIRCATIPGGGITGENATWNSCFPSPFRPNPALEGLPNCQGAFCIPCNGNEQIPGQPRRMSASFVSDDSQAPPSCGDGTVTPPEVCDPEDPAATAQESTDEDCLDIDCGLDAE